VKITNLEETIAILRTKLPDYLAKKGIVSDVKQRFNCFLHDDIHPSMGLNPKAGYEVAVCFACNQHADIFKAAHILEDLPEHGAEWITETIPALCDYLEVPISLGQPTEQELLRSKFYMLARDAADIIQHPRNTATDYTAKRGWENNLEDCYSVDFEEVVSGLIAKGWARDIVMSARLINVGANVPLVGADKVTWVIRDHRGRAVAFISRNLGDQGPKYIHSAESPVFQKRDILYGLDLALEDKNKPLYIVEGPGDRFALLHAGFTNVVALCGVALTDSHLNHLKTLGIRDLVLCLDWDTAGEDAIKRVVHTLNTKRISGFNIKVVESPSSFKDIDAYLHSGKAYEDLQIIDLFDWLVARTNLADPSDITKQLVPTIAAATTAIQRDLLARRLSVLTGIQVAAILSDVDRIRNHSLEQRRERFLASASKYQSSVEQDPTNIQAHIATHEQEISDIENEFGKDSFGVNYQLARFDSLQTLKNDSDVDRSEITLSKYSYFAAAMSNGLPWTTGTLIYWGGRANASKTACALAISLDAVLSDPDCMVVLHLTDDSYKIVEPRLVTNFAYLLSGKQMLTIGEASSPRKGFKNAEHSALYAQATAALRAAISDERLLIIDSEDGNNLSVLERTVKYSRRKYPYRKILIVADGTHNYSDFGHLDPTARITRICDNQKRMTVKYDCVMFATAEYRKNMPFDTTKIKLPVNDDLADARALMFRASVIIHVYNDLNDRQDCAEAVWMKAGKRCPRLMLIYGKNKVTGFKERLIMDLDPDTVTLKQVDFYTAAKEIDNMMNDEGYVEGDNLVKKTDWSDDDS